MPEQDWVKNSQSFDSVPEEYDAFRPSYPDRLFETIISVSKIGPQAHILEIGSGTGKATLPLAQMGFCIHCIEPGGNLIRVARRKLAGYPQVTFEQVRFEDWNGSIGEFDLVISAQAFHWIEPVLGYEKVANSLKPGGHLALFWNKHAETQDPIEEELQAVYRDMALESAEPDKRIEQEIKERRAVIRSSGFFSEGNRETVPLVRMVRLPGISRVIGNLFRPHRPLRAEAEEPAGRDRGGDPKAWRLDRKALPGSTLFGSTAIMKEGIF